MYSKILLFFLGAIIASKGEVELPSYLEKLVCRRSDPHYNDCFRTGLKEGFNYLLNGVKELNFPPLDPLIVEYFQFNHTISESTDFSIVLTNMAMTGMKGTIFQKVVGDPVKLRNEVNLLIPRIHLSLDYDVRGKFLNVPVNMQGFLEGDFVDLAIKIKSAMRLYEINSIEHLALEKLNIQLKLGDGKIKLFASDPEQQTMAQHIMKMFNENPSGVVDAVSPVVIERIQSIIVDYMNDMLAQIPASKVLPE